MSNQKGYDPFSDDHTESASEAAPSRIMNDPMDELLAADDCVPPPPAAGGDDGWAPIEEEETWTPAHSSFQLEDEIISAPTADETAVEPTRTTTTSGSFSAPSHSNPLPGFGGPPMGGVRAESPKLDRPELPAPDSNEAILQSGTQSALRSALPRRSDAPPPPISRFDEPRPVAWVLPGIVLAVGLAAGLYVMFGQNPIFGGIAIALSVVGSLLLRVMLKQ